VILVISFVSSVWSAWFGDIIFQMEGIPSEWNLMLRMGSAAVAKRLWQAG